MIEDSDTGGTGQDQPDTGHSGPKARRLPRHADGDAVRVPGGHRDGDGDGGGLLPAGGGHRPAGGKTHAGAAGGGVVAGEAVGQYAGQSNTMKPAQ